jgi:CBS domain containing-hemolysin-like protein
MIADLLQQRPIDEAGGRLRTPIVLPDTAGVLKAMETLKRSHGQVVLVTDEYGVVQGLLTPVDILEAIAGEFPDEDEELAIQLKAPGVWEVAGAADLHLLEQVLETDTLVRDDADYSSLAGFLLAHFEGFPDVGQALELDGLRYEILAVEERRIVKVSVRRIVTTTVEENA